MWAPQVTFSDERKEWASHSHFLKGRSVLCFSAALLVSVFVIQ